MPFVAIWLYWLLTALLFGAYLAADGELSVIDLLILAVYTNLSLVIALLLTVILGLLQITGSQKPGKIPAPPEKQAIP